MCVSALLSFWRHGGEDDFVRVVSKKGLNGDAAPQKKIVSSPVWLHDF